MSAAGIQSDYVDALGTRHHASPETVQAIARAMSAGGRTRAGLARNAPEVIVVRTGDPRAVGPCEIVLEDGSRLTLKAVLPADLPTGYHTIARRRGRAGRLIVTPHACYLPDDFRAWGWAIQLYAARSRRSWGIGDLADLRTLNRWAKGQGARLALINPLSAPMPLLPQQPSPYFPSSRVFRSPLYLRVEEVPGASSTPDIAALARRGRALNRERLIDRDAVFALKMPALEQIWKSARGRRDPDFDRFVRERARPLEEYATFCALAEHFGAGWHNWPAAYQHPASPAVRRAAADSATRARILFHQWLQYQVDVQLARAGAVLPVMQDLPIGFDADGADAWSFQDTIADGISVGAPPDEFNTRGQDWGLPPFVPDRLRAAGYEPFVQTIRACVQHGGGLRIDHVMGLFRLFWIPRGMEPAQGAYVASHADELLGIVSLESQRAKSLIVGEDLGTVEERARAALSSHRILSYRLVWFEKTDPAQFPERALSAITTHDLPTVAGLWTGFDLAEQKRLHLAPNEASTREIHQRVGRMVNAGPYAGPDGSGQGARGAGFRAVPHPDGDARRRDGGAGTAEHAGDDRRVAELVAGAARAGRIAEGPAAGVEDRAGAEPTPAAQTTLAPPPLACGGGAVGRAARDHHLGCLDHGHGFFPAAQLELFDRVPRNHRGQRLIPDSQAHLREEPVDAHLLDDAVELVAAAERDEDTRRPADRRLFLRAGGQQPIDLDLRNAVVPPGGRPVRMAPV